MIDIFSKLSWAVPVHFRDAKAITAAFGQMLTTVNLRNSKRLQTDKGKKFVDLNIQTLIILHGINHFAIESEQKATVMERFNRIIKTKIWTYLSYWGTVRWLNEIQDLVDAYNNSRHRSIGMAPSDFHIINENCFYLRLFGNEDNYLKPQVPNKSIMQACSHKTVFDKRYMPNWSKKHCTVRKALLPRKRTKGRVYKLMDYNDESVKDSWYPQKIQNFLEN